MAKRGVEMPFLDETGEDMRDRLAGKSKNQTSFSSTVFGSDISKGNEDGFG